MIIVNTKGRIIEHALKEYRQRVSKCKLHQELRDRTTFEKPSVKKRKIENIAKYRNEYGKN